MSSQNKNAGITIKILPYLWPKDRNDLKIRVVFSLIMLLIAKIITVSIPFIYKYAVDILVAINKSNALVSVPIFLIIAYGIGRVMMVLFNQIRDALFAKIGQNAVKQLAIKTFIHLHNLSLRFHLERKTGGLSRIIERGTKGVEIILRYSLFNTIPVIIEIVLVCGILAYNFGLLFAVVLAITIGLYVTFTYLATEWRINIRRRMNDADTDANTKAIDSLLNFETVKYFGNEIHEAKRFSKAITNYEKAATKVMTSLSILNSGQSIIFSIGLTICMIMSAQAVTNQGHTIGDFVMLNALLIQLYMPLNFLGSVYRDIKQGITDLETMFSLLYITPEIKDNENPITPEIDKAEIKFINVDFSYESKRPIIKNISFKVPGGHTLAIVGPSGAGKSTISRLLFRFYDVSSGKILIDGQDIAKMPQEELREHIGIVPQDTVLFNDTIEYNINYGRPNATKEEVIEAAKLAQIHHFITKLPNGYNTIVGERGLKLSGGEKQRVAIARTILKRPQILILDEATSALDSYTELEIQDALRYVAKGRTTLIVAHRLSTIVDADNIIVFDEGRIVEQGTHKELLDNGGLYAGMWHKQKEATAKEKNKLTEEINA